MDEPEGFFPERELLAYRRSLRQAPPPAAGDVGGDRFPWWLLPFCLSPVSVAWVCAAPHGLPPILSFGAWFLLACALLIAVLGICVGVYRSLRMLLL